MVGQAESCTILPVDLVNVRSYYNVALMGKLWELKAQAFEDFFVRIMSLAYPDGDFMPVKPAGRLGDHSSDGLLKYINPNTGQSAEKFIQRHFAGVS